MRPSMTLLVAVLTAWLLPAVDPGRCEARHLNIIQVQDNINPGVLDFITDAVAQSTEESAECLVIELDTPGGLMTAMRQIVQVILNASIPIVVYVSPSGAQAASAGVLITVAADIAAMAPGTNIGAAHPVTASGGDVPETMNEKVVNDMVAFARSVASQRGRNPRWLEDAIRKSISSTAEEAFAQNVIDLVAEDLPQLLDKLDGWEIQRKGQARALHTRDTQQRRIEPSWRHKVLRAVSNPNIAYILMMIGLAGLYFELSQPGAVLPGVIGAIALILAFYSMQTLSVNYAGFLFIVLAIVLFLLEIKIASYGMLSLAGVLSLVLGSLMLFRSPGQPNRLALSVLIPTVLAVSAFFITVAGLAFRAQMARPLTGKPALLGRIGEARTALAPEGKILVAGEIWNAECDQPVAVGEKVEVLSVHNLKLKVKKIDASKA